ncbi:glycerate kinase [Gracilibacillus alcaliphilus]|uniref:glycerate kinase n=1 Tax=Gracilibacillus alcaliphilus TaxID=1401441 RepID=UPI00195908B0|nr:glycerate kinase [Gracilibacillus alcaliphilus]MBM7676702.1 glycerate kinase [Gracilibacillus alcaliphilus]
MKIIIAPDSFKGSLSAIDAANAMDRGIRKAFPQAETVLLPVADGGEGTLETLVTATKGEIREIHVAGPLGEEVLAAYGVLGDQQICVIEMATASGLTLISEEELSPLTATTYGTGQLIKQALDDGFNSFIIALGGSATNDGGAGMLQALGLKLLDKKGKEVGYGGGALNQIASIDISSFDARIKDCMFLIASDVENPLIGPNGASHIFGPQKGATPEMVEQLDHNLAHFADQVEKATDIRLHDRPGAGAAGGIGGAFQAFFPCEVQRGIDVVLEYSRMAAFLSDANLVITGEGKVDGQTASGKTPLGVAQLAQKHDVPTIIIAGAVGAGAEILHSYGVVSIHSLINQPMPLEEAVDQAAVLLESSTEQIVRTYFHTTN